MCPNAAAQKTKLNTVHCAALAQLAAGWTEDRQHRGPRGKMPGRGGGQARGHEAPNAGQLHQCGMNVSSVPPQSIEELSLSNAKLGDS